MSESVRQILRVMRIDDLVVVLERVESSCLMLKTVVILVEDINVEIESLLSIQVILWFERYVSVNQ